MKCAKNIGKLLLFIIAFILIYFSLAFVFSRITIEEEIGAKDEVAIYILTNGVHTDIVLPVKNHVIDWSQRVRYFNSDSNNNANFLAMGWGDKGFYLETPTWSDLKASVAFKAATGLSNSAIHTTYYKSMNESDKCKKILISNNQYQRLVTFISTSFQEDSNGHFIQIKTNANYGNSDAFYEANGNYSIFHTCNTWANNALKASGQKSCLWTPFDTGIFLKY